MQFPLVYFPCSFLCRCSRLPPGAAGAGDAIASALVGRVPESVCQAGLQFGEAVQALGGRVRNASQDRADDLVLPAGDCPGEGQEFGDVVVVGAPVVEGGQPAADVTLARGGSGGAGAQVQHVAELFLPDPGRKDLLPGRVTAQGADHLGELGRGQVLQVPGQQVLDAVLGVTGPAAAPVPAAHDAAAHG